MIHGREKGLEERVRRLEADVRGQERELDRLRLRLASEGAVPGRSGDGSRPPDALGEDAPAEAGVDLVSEGVWQGLELPFELAKLRRWEWWMNKVGIALFLMGVVFLFKFSWDRGWLQVFLTPTVRVGLGIVLGSALVWVGLRVYAGRRAFAQVVLGGGIGTYYITGFAAYGMLDLLSYPVAFAFMAAVTLLAFALALRQDGAVLAVIGVSGGLATPFLLYDGEGAIWGLVLYAGLVLTGAMGIYLYRGWVSLLITSFGGYWAVLLTGHADAAPVDVPTFAEGVALQAGVVFGWLSLWLVPAAREALCSANPGRWRVQRNGPSGRVFSGRISLDNGTLARLFSFALPLISLWMTQLLWYPGRTTMGLLVLGVAAFHGLAWAGFRRVERGGRVPYTQAIAALLFATLSLPFLLEGNALLIAFAAEAAFLHLIGRRVADKALVFIAHSLSAFVGLWLLGRVVAGVPFSWDPTTAVFNLRGLVDLAALGLLLASSWFVVDRKAVAVYRVVVHAALLLWLWRELAMLPGSSDAYVTVAWGLAGAAMFVAGLRRDHAYPIRGGVATLFLVVAKLFLWDLAGLDPLWRVLLFLGFGGLFLVLSYHLRNLWKPRDGGLDTPDLPDAPPSRRPA